MFLPQRMCTVFTLSCTYMIVNIITVSVLPAFAATTTTIIAVNNFTIKPTTATNEATSHANPTRATNQKTTTLAITISTYDTTTASTQGTIPAVLTISPDATTTASTQLTTTSPITTSPNDTIAATNQVTTTSPITSSPNDTIAATNQVTTTSPITSSTNGTIAAATQVTATSPITTSPNDTIAATTQVTTTSPISTSPNDTIVATTQVTTTSPITSSPNDTIAATNQVTTTSPITSSTNGTIAAATHVTATSALTTFSNETATTSTQVTTVSPITTSPNDTIAATTQVTTTSTITSSPNGTIVATTQVTTKSTITTSPNDTIAATTQVTMSSPITTSPNDTITATTQVTTTSPITTSPNDTITATTQVTTTSPITTSPNDTIAATTQVTTTSALTTFSNETATTSTQVATAAPSTTDLVDTTALSTVVTTISTKTTTSDETTTAAIHETSALPTTTSFVASTNSSTVDTTTPAISISLNETSPSPITTSLDKITTASTVETTTLPLITSTVASTQDVTTLAITISPVETITASTLETTISDIITSLVETTTASTQATTPFTITNFPDETSSLPQESTQLAITTSSVETTTASTVETTTLPIITSPVEPTTASTRETTTLAITTSPDETTIASTQETTTSALTTSPYITTMVSTVETTTSTITTPDETTKASTIETTTLAVTTVPNDITTVSTQATTTSASTTSPDATTMVSTQETTTSAITSSTNVKTTHNLETQTTVQLPTSSPLVITTSTKVVTAYCPENIFNNITWSKVAAGEKDTQKCPPGYTGNAFRKCNGNGDWEDPVYLECVNMELHGTTDKINSLKNSTNSTLAAQIISDVLNTIDKTLGKETPTSGDLKHTTNILTDIIGIGTSSNASVNSEKFGDVLNSVLNTNNSGSWNEVNSEEQSNNSASNIMRLVDSLGSLVQKNLSSNETIIINKTNLVIQVSTMKKNLTFPPDSNSISKLILADQPSLQDTLYTAALYRTLSGILPTTPNRSVGSDVISVSFGENVHNLSENIIIRFEQNKKVNYTDPKISCGYWNFSARSWASSGCYLKQTESNVSTCTCNHLTNFAILMSPSDFEITDLHQKALEIITFVGCGLSILGCTLTLITYYVFWRYVKNEWTVILSNMCVVLIIGYSVFLSSTNVTDNGIACIIVTAILHYVFLVVFFLMLCEGISVARSVTVVFKRKSEARFYLPFAWGVPLVIVGITLGVTRLKGYHSEKYCWLSTNNFVFVAFVGPALLVILINIGIIHVVLKAIYSTNAMVNERLKKKVRAGVKCMVVLIPVLGLSWLFGILAYNEDTIIFQYLFGITTSLQGFIIFIRDAVSNKKLHEGIRKALHRYRSKSMLKASSKTQSSGLQNRFDFKDIKNSFNERKRIVAYTKQIVKLVINLKLKFDEI